MYMWLLAVWRRRQWLYAAYIVVAIARIPARTGFRFACPACDLHLTLANAALSLTKLSHLVLFGVFFVLTVVQFARVNRTAVGWSILATVVLGALVELEEGATCTGNCRMTDMLPDLAGALVGTAGVMLLVIGQRHWRLRAGLQR